MINTEYQNTTTNCQIKIKRATLELVGSPNNQHPGGGGLNRFIESGVKCYTEQVCRAAMSRIPPECVCVCVCVRACACMCLFICVTTDVTFCICPLLPQPALR